MPKKKDKRWPRGHCKHCQRFQRYTKDREKNLTCAFCGKDNKEKND